MKIKISIFAARAIKELNKSFMMKWFGYVDQTLDKKDKI